LGIDRHCDGIGDVDRAGPFLEHQLIFTERSLRDGQWGDHARNEKGGKQPRGGNDGEGHKKAKVNLERNHAQLEASRFHPAASL
jgi:hypothetical protein